MALWKPPTCDDHGRVKCLICSKVTYTCKCSSAERSTHYERCDSCKERVANASPEELRELVDELFEMVHSLRRYTITYKPMSERRF